MPSDLTDADEVTITVITVNYNSGADLRKTIDSILIQADRPDQYIIKDGGSTDVDKALIARAQKELIEWVVTSDSGIYDAMNQAIAIARSTYCLFLNSGDVIASADVICKVRCFLQNNKNIDILYGDYEDEMGQVIRSPGTISKWVLFRHVVCHQVCFIRTGLLLGNGGYGNEYRVCADNDFFIKMIIELGKCVKHVPLVVAKMKKQGFSLKYERIARLEARLIRQTYYGKVEYMAYNALYILTLPRLRAVIARSPFFSRAYYALREFVSDNR